MPAELSHIYENLFKYYPRSFVPEAKMIKRMKWLYMMITRGKRLSPNGWVRLLRSS